MRKLLEECFGNWNVQETLITITICDGSNLVAFIQQLCEKFNKNISNSFILSNSHILSVVITSNLAVGDSLDLFIVEVHSTLGILSSIRCFKKCRNVTQKIEIKL